MKTGAAFGFCIILLGIFAGDRGLPAVLKARRDARELAAAISMLQAENARLRTQADQLRSDPAAIEAVARETLGFVRPGEIVLIRRR
jgi:cell division protein FtsB